MISEQIGRNGFAEMGWQTAAQPSKGFVLVIVMILLAAMASVGVSSMRSALMELRLVTAVTQNQQLLQYADVGIDCALRAVRESGYVSAEHLGALSSQLVGATLSLEGASCPTTPAAQLALTLDQVKVSVFTQYCGHAGPSVSAPSDPDIFNDEYYVTTAAVDQPSVPTRPIVQQGWSRRVQMDLSYLPEAALPSGVSLRGWCEQNRGLP